MFDTQSQRGKVSGQGVVIPAPKPAEPPKEQK